MLVAAAKDQFDNEILIIFLVFIFLMVSAGVVFIDLTRQIETGNPAQENPAEYTRIITV